MGNDLKVIQHDIENLFILLSEISELVDSIVNNINQEGKREQRGQRNITVSEHNSHETDSISRHPVVQ